MQDIKGFDSFISVEPLRKGWSEDRKYFVQTQEDGPQLLRLADISQLDKKKQEYEWLKQAEKLGIPASRPLDFGVCCEGRAVYTRLTWAEGEDAETLLPLLSEAEQYELGRLTGVYLRRLHSLPAPADTEDWEIRFNRKLDGKIEKYTACPLHFEGDHLILDYIEQNRHLLKNRPQSFQHGDYHVGNMIIGENRDITIIDFNRFDFGDPWEEFNRIVWSAAASPYFATGQLNGYFGGRPPEEFFRLLALYISGNTLSSIYWAIPFGQREIDTMMAQSRQVLSWFGNMQNPVPGWYLGDLCIRYIDGLPCRLKSPFDFSFLRTYGTVFKIFDDQDSGNICFGIQREAHRYFVKFAGAPTAEYDGSAGDAVKRLADTLPVYRELTHPNLIHLIKSESIGGGLCLLFDWEDAVCMGRMYPESNRAFQAIPMEEKLQIYWDILTFHRFAAEQGYVAIDFYDGSVLYDRARRKTILCDIDFYAKQPYTNRMGRMWGSARFMSPEEYQAGAVIDEITNVYTMGATAFALFADYDRSEENWLLNHALYRTAVRAVSDERSQRQPSLQAFTDEWEQGLRDNSLS